MRAAGSTFKTSKTCPEVLGWWRARSLAPNFMIKTINVDWDSYEDIRTNFNRIKSRYLELRRQELHLPSKKERNRRLLDACFDIWQADISDIYSGISLSEARDYYVYAHLDTTKGIAIHAGGVTAFAATLGMNCWPFYIGKGIGERCSDLQRNETHRKVRERITRFGREPQVIKLKENLTEREALEYEAKLIDIFGLITNAGLLSNLDEGIHPQLRRMKYPEAYQTLRRINVPPSVTHVENAGATDKTRVVPAISTGCSRK